MSTEDLRRIGAKLNNVDPAIEDLYIFDCVKVPFNICPITTDVHNVQLFGALTKIENLKYHATRDGEAIFRCIKSIVAKLLKLYSFQQR